MAQSPRARRVNNARTRGNYEASPEELAMREWMAPIPRDRYGSMTDAELGEEVKRLFILKKAEAAPRIALDLRLIKWYDPQRMSDVWQDVYTGRLIPKLYHSTGLAVENVPWSGAVVDGMVGLLSGNKPMAYLYDVEPEDPESDADVIQADLIEEYLDRWVDTTDYDITYLDHVTDVVMLGRSCKYVYTDSDTSDVCAEVLWPGNVTGFFMPDKRNYEQVTIEKQMTVSEAINQYAGGSPEKKAMIENAVRAPASLGVQPYMQSRLSSSTMTRNLASVTVLEHWYRTGVGKWGVDPDTVHDERPHRLIGMCAVLLYDGANGDKGTYTLYRENDTNYEDVPVMCTPRMKVSGKNADESYGVLMRVAGLHTQYNEVFSAFRDMLWRTIYARYVAKGFTFRNAPKLIPGSAIYALPRTDQDFKRIEETVNTTPIEQFLTHLEELIIVLSGLNRYFLGSAPPTETSGESINAAINASITQLQPVRSNIQRGEEWTYEQVLAQSEAFVVMRFQGRTVTMASIIENKRSVSINWRDVTPKDAEKAKRGAIEGMNAGLIAHETAQDEWNVHNKTSEMRKIKKERQDVWLSPQTVAAASQAMLQQAMAKRQIAMLAAQAAQPQVQQQMFGASGAQTNSLDVAPAVPGAGPVAPPQGGPTPAQSNATARTAQARSAPKQGSQYDNAAQGPGTAGGRAAQQIAPPARGQQPQPRRLGRIGGR